MKQEEQHEELMKSQQYVLDAIRSIDFIVTVYT